MQQIPVISHEIKSIGYEGSTLEIVYKNGSTYQFYRVPENVFEEFLTSRFMNTYFQDNIRNIYRYHKTS